VPHSLVKTQSQKSPSPASLPFTDEQIERYSRHIILPEVGGTGQKKIRAARVLLIGTGGLGSPMGYYLAAAGVGRLGLVDADHVELSNLQRQVLHFTPDIGKPKVQSAKEKLEALNPEIEVVAHQIRLTSQNINDILSQYDIVADGSDNFPTRYLVNDACVMSGKPLVSGAIFRFEGQVMTVIPKKTACYRCLFPEPPPPGLVPACQEAGILGVVAGVIGSLQAAEILKVILKRNEGLINRLLIFNGLDMHFRDVSIQRDTNCAVCGENPTVKELIDYEQFCSRQ